MDTTMKKAVLILLFSVGGLLVASSSGKTPCGAISSWGSDQVKFVNCSLKGLKGNIFGFVRLGALMQNEGAKTTLGMCHFDPIDVVNYFSLHAHEVMEKIKQEKKPSTHYAWCFQAMHCLERSYNEAAKKCMSVQSVEALQLAFCLENTISVIYACNKKDEKRLFPPIQLIEYFPDIVQAHAGIMLLTGDAITKDDGKCEVISFPFKDRQPLSVVYPKKTCDLKLLVDSIAPQILEKGKRTFSGKSQSKALVIALHVLSNYDENLNNTDEDMCTIS